MGEECGGGIGWFPKCILEGGRQEEENGRDGVRVIGGDGHQRKGRSV